MSKKICFSISLTTSFNEPKALFYEFFQLLYNQNAFQVSLKLCHLSIEKLTSQKLFSLAYCVETFLN